MKTPSILVVEDEPGMRSGLQDNLEFEDYHVDTAPDGDIGWQLIQLKSYDLIILDVMMPKMSGYDVLKLMRKSEIKSPVIMLTAKGEELDRVRGLELGADDYITKPFSLREFLARVKAVLRRTFHSSSDTTVPTATEEIRLGLLTFNFAKFSAVNAKKEEVDFSHKELQLIEYLWNHATEVVSRDDLLKNVWGYDSTPTTRTVDNFILRIRQKVEPHPAKPVHILTVHGMGYKLIP